MIGQISPLVKRNSLQAFSCSFVYTIGVTFGAAVIGTLIGSFGHLVQWLLGTTWRPDNRYLLIAVGIAALTGAVRDLGFFKIRLCQPNAQVPRHWFYVFGAVRAAFLWGLGIGLFTRTMIQFSLYYVVAFWILLAGNPLLGALILGLYGLTQGLLLILEVLTVKLGASPLEGLLGSERSDFLFRFGGVALLLCSLSLILYPLW